MTRIGGHRWRQIVRAVLEESDVCHLCGRPGADSGDHLVPVSVRPDLEMVIDNVRPAHLICNQRRGTAPIGIPRPLRTSRVW